MSEVISFSLRNCERLRERYSAHPRRRTPEKSTPKRLAGVDEAQLLLCTEFLRILTYQKSRDHEGMKIQPCTPEMLGAHLITRWEKGAWPFWAF
jgi:hypothetical protein